MSPNLVGVASFKGNLLGAEEAGYKKKLFVARERECARCLREHQPLRQAAGVDFFLFPGLNAICLLQILGGLQHLITRTYC